jgi:hypothetical protein
MGRDEEDDESEEDKEKGTFNLALKSRVQSWSKVIYIFAYFSISLGAPPYEQLATLVEQSAALVQEPSFFFFGMLQMLCEVQVRKGRRTIHPELLRARTCGVKTSKASTLSE